MKADLTRNASSMCVLKFIDEVGVLYKYTERDRSPYNPDNVFLQSWFFNSGYDKSKYHNYENQRMTENEGLSVQCASPVWELHIVQQVHIPLVSTVI